jgi:hypothetical protein
MTVGAFRKLTNAEDCRYENVGRTCTQRRAVAETVRNMICECGARFLMCIDNHWECVARRCAVDKLSHALRCEAEERETANELRIPKAQ